MIRSRWVLWAFRIIVGGVFLWAGALKVADPLAFAQSIKNYRAFPHGLVFFIAIILPWVELLSGAGLIVGVLRRASALILSLLLVGFIGLVALALLRGIDTTCGCFGSFSRPADWTLVLTDVILLFFTLQVFFSESGRRPAR
jgi:hypothetical protein